MANYQIYYREITDEYKAEKVGFSLGAFFFGWMWALYHGLKFQAFLGLILYGISLSYSFLAAGISEHGILVTRNQMGLLTALKRGEVTQMPVDGAFQTTALITLLMIYFGLQGRNWLANQLLDFDFVALGSQKGRNKADALKVATAKLEGALENSAEKLSKFPKKTDKFKEIHSPLAETKLLDWGIIYYVITAVALILIYNG